MSSFRNRSKYPIKCLSLDVIKCTRMHVSWIANRFMRGVAARRQWSPCATVDLCAAPLQESVERGEDLVKSKCILFIYILVRNIVPGLTGCWVFINPPGLVLRNIGRNTVCAKGEKWKLFRNFSGCCKPLGIVNYRPCLRELFLLGLVLTLNCSARYTLGESTYIH